jgi:C-terminal processing protease CtpA/Prc
MLAIAAALSLPAVSFADATPAAAPIAQQAPPPRRGPPQQDMVLDQAKRADVLARLIAGLNGYYVFPDQAKAMEAELRAQDQRGAYAQITSAEAFATTLTEDLQRVTKDRHLEVAYSARPFPPQEVFDTEETTPEDMERQRRLNFGVEHVQRMDFNLGYLDLRAFAPPALSGPKLAAAMSLLADTDALVIDLRNNGGGDPATVALLASYLFDQRTRLNDIYDRGKDSTTQYWTSDAHAGPKYGGGKKLYLLVSHDTFSAGEDFAYALKNLKRATLIGATTGGGAHPGTARRLTDHFAAMVPTGRSISPITHGDWEGTGVVPDVVVDPEKALEKAQSLYMTDLLATEKDEGRRQRIAERLSELAKGN